MNIKVLAKIIIDILITILMLFSLAFRITNNFFHEWIGIILTVLFIIHHFINLQWYKQLFKGKYNLYRSINTVNNFLLTGTMATVIITGILHSRYLLSFLQINSGMAVRQLHTAAAYWGFILIAIHIGLHWKMILTIFRKMFHISNNHIVRTLILKLITGVIVVYGIYSSFDRDIGLKLFRNYSFDFWPPEKPVILFFTENISIMSIYIFITYYVLKFIKEK